jgi:hypothetical protein
VKHATIVFWRRRLLDDRRQESKFQMGAPEVWMIYPAARTAYARRDGVGTVYTSGPVALLGMWRKSFGRSTRISYSVMAKV